jgi:hypothetical protein
MFTEDNGFLPNQSFVAYLVGFERNLCFEVLHRESQTDKDTIFTVLADFAYENFGGGAARDIVAMGIAPLPSPVVIFKDPQEVTTDFPICGPLYLKDSHDNYHFTTGPLTQASNIVTGDFDSDGDLDFVATGASENRIMFVRNEGSFTFVADSIATTSSRGIAALDYENDGDLDFVTINRPLDSLGITIFLNNGHGQFEDKPNCHFPFASGWPTGIVAADFDRDGKTDIAITTFDSLFVLYNLGGFNDAGGVTNVDEHHGAFVPTELSLSQNYPNPFNPTTNLSFVIRTSSFVSLKVYDVLGREVATLVGEDLKPGSYEMPFDGSELASGVYFYRIEVRQAGRPYSIASVKKMVLMK